MKIHQNDWVLQYRLNRIYGHYNYSYHSLPKDKIGLRLHAVLPPTGVRHGQNLEMLYKWLNKPIYSIFSLPSGDHWRGGEMPKYEPARALNGVLGYESKKRVAADYLRVLSEHLVPPRRPDSETTAMVDQKHSDEIRDLLRRLKKLEGRPMKAHTKKYIIELNLYDIEKKRPDSEREFLILTKNRDHPTNAADIHNIVKRSFVKTDDSWCTTHDIVYIEENYYTITSGEVEYTKDRFDILSNHGEKKPLKDLDMIQPIYFHLKYSYDGKTGVETIHVPSGIWPNQVLTYYQNKYPNRNYKLSDKPKKEEDVKPEKGSTLDLTSEFMDTFDSSKPVTKKTTERKQELPKKGETPAKDTRKVCYKHKDSAIIYRAPHKKVRKLIEDDENYEYVSKRAWKTQRVEQKSNITLPISRNLDDLGKRGERREERESLKARRRRTPGKSRGPSVSAAQRVEQAEKDRAAYIERLAAKGRKPRQHLIPRCFQAVILGEKGVIVDTINIKAVNEDHAAKLMGRIAQQRKKLMRLNGVVTDWKK
jgi:hypothetical protein